MLLFIYFGNFKKYLFVAKFSQSNTEVCKKLSIDFSVNKIVYTATNIIWKSIKNNFYKKKLYKSGNQEQISVFQNGKRFFFGKYSEE